MKLTRVHPTPSLDVVEQDRPSPLLFLCRNCSMLWIHGCMPVKGEKEHCSFVNQKKINKNSCTIFITGFLPTFLHSQNTRILYKIPRIIFFFFFNVASTYNWVSVYTLNITSTPFCLHYPKVCIPPLTATHNDLYHFERWVLIKKKKKQKLMT